MEVWRGVFVALLANTTATSTSTLYRKMELKNLRIDIIRRRDTENVQQKQEDEKELNGATCHAPLPFTATSFSSLASQ